MQSHLRKRVAEASLLFWCISAVTIPLCGCGSSDSGPMKYQVSGEVTFQDQPVPAGWVIFEPDSEKGTEGPAGIGQIQNGRYVTDRGKGVVGGNYLVKVVGRTGVPIEQDGNVEPLGAVLFPEHHFEVEFPHANSTQNFTVPASPTE